MPLSEHEQRQLEEIERALYREDPKFAHSVRYRDPRTHYRHRALQAVVGFVVGVGLLVAGIVLRRLSLEAAGVVVAAVFGAWAVVNWRRWSAIATAARPPGRPHDGPVRGTRGGSRPRTPAGGAGFAGFMERLEERWRRRQEGGR